MILNYMNYREYGAWLEEKMREMGYSQKELAKRAGLTDSCICHYIKGRRVPRLDCLVKINLALGYVFDVKEVTFREETWEK